MKNLIFILLFFTLFSYSQTTLSKFSRNGFLADKPNVASKTLCEFRKNKDVEILDYIYGDWWKVKYKNCIGYVTSPFIIINEELNKIKADKILKVANDGKREQDSIKKANDSIKKANDSILKVKAVLKVKELKRVDSIKRIITKYAEDSLLTSVAKSNSKLKDKPKIYADIIETYNNKKEYIILDYINGFFKVSTDSKHGFVSEMYFNQKSVLLKEFIRVKDIEYKEEYRKEKLRELENEKNLYFNDCRYDTNEKDEFTGLTRKNTIFYKVQGYYSRELEIRLKRYGNSKFVVIRSQRDLGCTSSYSNSRSNVKFKLENGNIVTFYHVGDVDCGDFELLGRLTPNDIAKLKNSPIKTVRLTGTDFYHDVKNLFFKDFFIKKIDCIK